MKKILLLLMICGNLAYSQINIEVSQTVTQNFNILGIDEIATLPTNWRVSKSNTYRSVSAYADAGNQTERRGGNSLATNAANGIYNFGDGVANSATNRSVGFLSSGTETRSGNLFAHFNNSGASPIVNLSISYNIKKFRDGENPIGFTIQLYYSADGVNWISLGDNFKTSFVADASNAGFASAPGVTIPVTNNFNLPNSRTTNDNFYLAWNYSVTSGSTSTNAQALSIDDVSVTANNTLPIQLSSFTAQAIDKTILLNWETLSETNNASFDIERSTDGKNFTKIGSKEGSGTTTALTKYRFVDENPLPGTNYYRLKQIDFDGKSEISAVKSAFSNIPFATLSVVQSANTVTAQIISPEKEKAKLSLFDIGGRILAQQDITLEKGLNRFDFSLNLNSGVYFFKLTSVSSQVNTKFVKQ
jgi:hypothetical protein